MGVSHCILQLYRRGRVIAFTSCLCICNAWEDLPAALDQWLGEMMHIRDEDFSKNLGKEGG